MSTVDVKIATPGVVTSSTSAALLAQEAALHQAQNAETFRRFRRSVLGGAILWPAFGFADLMALSTFAGDVPSIAVVGPRLVFTFFLAGIVGFLYRRCQLSFNAMLAIDQALYGLANVFIGLMCLSLGGLTSHYLAGACLVVTARMFSLPLDWKRGLLANVLPALSAPLTLLLGAALSERLRPQLHDPVALGVFTLGVAYLLGTAFLMTTGTHIISTLRLQLSAERSIGRYKLRSRLGIGGMGEVWAAFHSGLKRDVALKILKPGPAAELAAARFEREVQATSELTHPNTIRVFDYGTTNDGLLYYAMELLRGEDLATLIGREGKLHPSRAVYLLNQAARALSEAHDRGIVHRDIKPENIFITTAGGESDFVKLIDFGIALREATEHSEPEMKLTSQDSVLGTPRYMAPEVMRGFPATTRSDVYALGAVLYLALTGKPAFDGPTRMALVGLILSEEEAAPLGSTAASPELAELVARAVAKDSSARFEDAGAMSLALQRTPEAKGWEPSRVDVHREPSQIEPEQVETNANRREPNHMTDTVTGVRSISK